MAVKRKAHRNYTQKTLAHLRELGCAVEKVEKFNAFAGPFGRREDAFGFLDIIALDPTRGIVGIQSTGPNGHAEHRAKILANPYASVWLECGGLIELWSWRKLLMRPDGKAKRWRPRIEPITEASFAEDKEGT